MLSLVDDLNANTVLDLKYKPRFQRLQHAWRAGFLSFFDATDEVLTLQAHVVDRPACADTWRQLAMIDALVEYQDTT